MTHEIKILESFADAVLRGDKNFEVRKNDRGYQRGDFVQFIPIYDSDKLPITSHPLCKKKYIITYVLSGWGIEEGYVVFGIAEPIEAMAAEIEQSEAEMMVEHKDGTVEYVKDIDNIMLLADKNYQIGYTGRF